MRNYYVFMMEHPQAGWMQQPTTWCFRKDAIDAMMQLSKENPDAQFLVGYQDDKDMLRIPDNINDVPER